MSGKVRLSASVDADLLAAAERAVATGAAPNVSAWVTDALRMKVESDRKLAALGRFIAEYEAEHGVITDEEMEDARREARRRSVPVRGTRAGEGRRKYGR
ncbi:MAG: hypothetical protein H0T46_20225 [Deltaproteobacteria bacterium]|nr:hypothetical protein [Deltaproteobacteria bacterium]